ncbi:MAG: hypothetical protein EZS28_030679 [Streblomastix strix]|uniref:Uncharacterized protein n=1 Tax=Streblomastix strix TaxID=222440 RepID=A0A5J4UTZ4_9EUKA|nr:MAG: hypothetical protein EZS28_030679 [Streblomastix strix]
MEEMANIDLSVSIIDDQEQRAAVCIPPKQTDLENISNKVQRTLQTYSRLRIGSKLIRNILAHILKDLFKHLEYKLQLQTALDMYLLQNQQHKGLMRGQQKFYIHHTPDLKMIKKFQILAVNKEQNSIASALVRNHGEKQATQIISKQRGDSRISDGDGLQQSPLGDDLQLSPQKTLASPLSLPIISTQPIFEAESTNDHDNAKVQNSQMQQDNQNVEPQDEAQNSRMTKDSDRAITSGALK